MIKFNQITCGVFAGGQARRLGGVDKAFVQLDGKSLLARTLAAFSADHAQILISHPGQSSLFSEFNVTVVADSRPDFAGPLAGLEAMLAQTRTPFLLTLPVDLRAIPADLCQRLMAMANVNDGCGAVVIDAEGLQPLVAIWPVAAARIAVAALFSAGGSAVQNVLSILPMEPLDISPECLGNLNTPADFVNTVALNASTISR